MNKRLIAITGTLTMVTAALAACGDATDSSSGSGSGGSGPVVVGSLLSMTGDESVYGPPYRKAGDLAESLLNASLKNAGSSTTIDVRNADDGSEPQAAVSAGRKLVAEGATCLAGPLSSAPTLAVGESVAARNQVPLIADASTSMKVTEMADDNYVFRVMPGDALQVPVLADLVQESVGLEGTISIAGRNDAFGQGFTSLFAAEWKSRGGKISGPVLYDPKAASFDSEAEQIVSGSPAAWVILDFPDSYAKMGAALVRTGKFDANRLFIAGGQPKTIPDGTPKEAMEGARGTRPGIPSGTAASKKFDELFAATESEIPRQSFDGNHFDAVMLCSLAGIAKQAHGGDLRELLTSISGAPGTKYDITNLDGAVKDLLAGKDIDYEGVGGSIDFDAKGDPKAGVYDIYKYENGAQVITGQKQSK